MKTLLLSLFLAVSSVSVASDFTGGLVVGSHIGFTGKLDWAKDRAVDIGITHAIDSMFSFSVNADYLFENVRHFGQDKDFHFYYGAGGRVTQIKNGQDEGKSRIAARAPLGLSHFSKPGFEWFGEIAPSLYLIDSSGFNLDVGVGFRTAF